jgi:cytochrome c biogenesis protein
MIKHFATDLIEFFGSKWVFGGLLVITIAGMIYSFSDSQEFPPILFFAGIWYTRLLWLTLALSTIIVFSKGIVSFAKNAVGKGFVQALYLFWTSIPLAISLIASLVFIGLMSTLIPQLSFNREVDLISRFGTENFEFLKNFYAFEIFSAPYTYALVILFVLNLTACTHKRLGASLKYVKMSLSPKIPEALKRMPENAILDVTDEQGPSIIEDVKKVLKSKGMAVREKGNQLAADKLKWERFAIDIFHISLLICIAALFVTNEFGYSFVQVNYKGDIFSVPERNFQVRVDEFWSENYENSERVMDWKTDLAILEDEQEMYRCTIEVNHPCTYQGVSIYQAAMGEDWLSGATLTYLVAKPMLDENGETVLNEDGVEILIPVGEYQALVGDSVEIPEENISIRLGAFLPDFALLNGKTAFTRTQRLINPAAFFEVSSLLTDSSGFQTWAFRDAEALQLQIDSPYRFFLTGMIAKSFTGLELSWDPGTPVAYTAFTIIILMLVGHVFLNHQMIWVSLDEATGKLYIGGRCRKGEFTENFDKIVTAIQSKTGLQVNLDERDEAEHSG